MKKDGKFISKITKNGFYIILFLCICAIGISGYVMFSAPELPDESQVLGDWGDELDFPPIEQKMGFEIEPVVSDTRVELPEEKPSPKKKEEPVSEKPVKKAEVKAKPKKNEPKVLSFEPAVEGEVLVPYSGDELVKSKTMGDWRTHNGVDIGAPEGTKVHAIASGTVSDVFEDEMMGHTVVIEHKDGCKSTYSNLMKGIVVKKGQTVKAGEVIGGIGSSAIAESLEPAHLHLELTENGENIDPLSVIK